MTGLEVLAIGAAVAGAGVSAAGAIQQGNTQSAVASYNAQMANYAAIAAVDRARADSERKRRDVDRLRGHNVANIGAAGLDVAGSPTAFLFDQAGEGELDALLIEYGGALEARGFESRAALYRAEASAAKSQGMMKAAGILLSGASQAASPLMKGGMGSSG